MREDFDAWFHDITVSIHENDPEKLRAMIAIQLRAELNTSMRKEHHADHLA